MRIGVRRAGQSTQTERAVDSKPESVRNTWGIAPVMSIDSNQTILTRTCTLLKIPKQKMPNKEKAKPTTDHQCRHTENEDLSKC